ncbi:MAG: 50S ribosomal protein L10 [Anaerolineae bacterium]
MAISREQKEKMVADYVEKMSRSQALILADYRGLTVSHMTDLRRKLREADGQFQVVKNSLLRLALEQSGLPVPEQVMEGPVAVGYCFDEAPPVAKTFMDFAKESDILKIKGAILGSNILDVEGVKGLADLPPREVLLAQLLGAVQGPMSSLASTLAAPMRELVQVLQARAEQGTDGEQPAEAAA